MIKRKILCNSLRKHKKGVDRNNDISALKKDHFQKIKNIDYKENYALGSVYFSFSKWSFFKRRYFIDSIDSTVKITKRPKCVQ